MTPAEEILRFRTRAAAGEPEGLLVLLHGRGADEHDLYPLLDLLDPERRRLGVTPRGPLAMPPGGAHWYVFHRVGFPEEQSFHAGRERLGRWLDALAEETGIPPARTVLGGFSQGAVMTFALGLSPGRDRLERLIALSGFAPTVEGWEPDLDRPLPPVAIGHGIADPIISVDFSRRARVLLEEAGANVLYRESPIPHTIDPGFVTELAGWMNAD